MKLRDSLDRLFEKQVELNVILERLTVTVEEHTKRSDALESHVKLLEQKIEDDIKPLEAHVNMVKGFAKYSVWVVTIVGGIVAIVVSLIKS